MALDAPPTGTELPVLPEVPRGGLRAVVARRPPARRYGCPSSASCSPAVAGAHCSRRAGRSCWSPRRDEDVAQAVAAVTRSLPRALATAVSFVTFTSAPGDADVLVVGTSPDVSIPVSPLGDQTVLRLGGRPSGARRHAATRARIEGCWRRSDDEAEEAVALASSIRPARRGATSWTGSRT